MGRRGITSLPPSCVSPRPPELRHGEGRTPGVAGERGVNFLQGWHIRCNAGGTPGAHSHATGHGTGRIALTQAGEPAYNSEELEIVYRLFHKDMAIEVRDEWDCLTGFFQKSRRRKPRSWGRMTLAGAAAARSTRSVIMKRTESVSRRWSRPRATRPLDEGEEAGLASLQRPSTRCVRGTVLARVDLSA